MPFDLSRIIFIATANDVSLLPPIIVDRLLVFDFAPPTGEQLIAVTRLICDAALAEFRHAFVAPDDRVVARLARANSRRIVKMVRIAVGYAAVAGRDHIIIADVDAAEALAGTPDARTPIGFLTPRSDPQEGEREGEKTSRCRGRAT